MKYQGLLKNKFGNLTGWFAGEIMEQKRTEGTKNYISVCSVCSVDSFKIRHKALGVSEEAQDLRLITKALRLVEETKQTEKTEHAAAGDCFPLLSSFPYVSFNLNTSLCF